TLKTRPSSAQMRKTALRAAGEAGDLVAAIPFAVEADDLGADFLICAEEGLVFNVTMTEDGTRHRGAQFAERRTVLAEALQGDAKRLTEQMWQPATIYNFGGNT
ncbi:hypothetical protein AB0L27_36555, partial [Streptomyces sp. NPDC052610]